MSKFHNPYNFVPTPERKTAAATRGDLGDDVPVGQHWYQPDRWTGRIDVTMTVETPLLVLDVARARESQEHRGHKTFPLRVGSDGLPSIPSTSVKGMLRAAYEAVTNSRMGVLPKHEQRLGYRMVADEGLNLVPARITDEGIQLMFGTQAWPLQAAAQGQRETYSAWLPRYGRSQPEIEAATYTDRTLPQHGDRAWAWLELFQHWRWNGTTLNQDFRFWRVRSIARSRKALPTQSPAQTDAITLAQAQAQRRSWYQPLGQLRVEKGFVCVTNQNIKNKHDERFFFGRPEETPMEASQLFMAWGTHREKLERQWADTIASYRRAHRRRDIWRQADDQIIPPEAYQGDTTGKTAWSPHQYRDSHPRLDDGRPQEDTSELRPDTLCYARLGPGSTPPVVTDLFPVAIARELFQSPPIALIDPSLRPAKTRSQLSPADRVFGWVQIRNDNAADPGEGSQVPRPAPEPAHRGQLRVGPVTCDSRGNAAIAPVPGDSLPLTILSNPKAEQSRFYLADRDGRPLNQPKKRAYIGADKQQVRGRKVYPHHQIGSQPDYWSSVQGVQGQPVREYASAGLPGSQNYSVEQWVPHGAVFTFPIYITNLSTVELGALVWLLQLPKGHFHRLGAGKPLGFGSVGLKIESHQLRIGTQMKERYLSLTRDPANHATETEIANSKSTFVNAVANVYPTDRFLESFMKACGGFDDGHPVAYPRTSPQPTAQGENFKWFQQNELERGKQIRDGGAPRYKTTDPLALPLLLDDDGLPFIIA